MNNTEKIEVLKLMSNGQIREAFRKIKDSTDDEIVSKYNNNIKTIDDLSIPSSFDIVIADEMEFQAELLYDEEEGLTNEELKIIEKLEKDPRKRILLANHILNCGKLDHTLSEMSGNIREIIYNYAKEEANEG